jgi:hypothetical protein
MKSLCALVVVGLAVGCSDGAGSTGSTSSSSSSSGGSSSGGGSSGGSSSGGDGFVELLGADWTLQAGTEDYLCVRYTLPEDLRISAFRPIAPSGTHHTVLSHGRTLGPDGVYNCNGFTNGPQMVFGSGLGTETLTFPDDVAITLYAGDQLVLNLHLFNAQIDAELSGYSGVSYKLAAAETSQEAQSVLVGTENILLQGGETTLTGRCPIQGDHTLFAVFPHMHQIATHMRVTIERGGNITETMMDQDYVFDDQRYSVLPTPIVVSQGDTIRVDCTYDNNTGHLVTYGESSNNEMCYAGVFHYPPSNGGLTCTSN